MTRGGPPPGADPVEWWVRMTEMPRPTSAETVLRVRGVGLPVRFWVLAPSELLAARSRATREVAALFGRPEPGFRNSARADATEALIGPELLALAARDSRDVSVPALSREGASGLTGSEVDSALTAYATFRRECGPSLLDLTKEEVDDWYEFLARGAERSPMVALDWGRADSPRETPGAGVLDCHFLCWVAARKVLYPKQ